MKSLSKQFWMRSLLLLNAFLDTFQNLPIQLQITTNTEESFHIRQYPLSDTYFRNLFGTNGYLTGCTLCYSCRTAIYAIFKQQMTFYTDLISFNPYLPRASKDRDKLETFSDCRVLQFSFIIFIIRYIEFLFSSFLLFFLVFKFFNFHIDRAYIWGLAFVIRIWQLLVFIYPCCACAYRHPIANTTPYYDFRTPTCKWDLLSYPLENTTKSTDSLSTAGWPCIIVLMSLQDPTIWLT